MIKYDYKVAYEAFEYYLVAKKFKKLYLFCLRLIKHLSIEL